MSANWSITVLIEGLKKKSKTSHLIVIIQDVLLDLGRIHPCDEIFHISKTSTVFGSGYAHFSHFYSHIYIVGFQCFRKMQSFYKVSIFTLWLGTLGLWWPLGRLAHLGLSEGHYHKTISALSKKPKLSPTLHVFPQHTKTSTHVCNTFCYCQ